MKVIDFRVRPPYKSFVNKWFFGEEVIAHYQHQGGMSISKSVKEKSMKLYLEEQNDAGIAHAVVTGRSGFGTSYSNVPEVCNEDIAAIVEDYPGLFTGVIGIPIERKKDALDEIDRYIKYGNCQGITIECGFSSIPMRYDDKRLYDIYKYCEEINAFIILTGGNVYSRLEEAAGVALDNIAMDFPNLRFILSHAGWPKLMEAIWVALKRDNVWLIPDFYMLNSPGKQDFVYAINTMLRDKMLYGSCYPLVSLEAAIQHTLESGVKDDVIEEYFYNNAKRLLGLNL